ncbi:uncharacterized protein [Drosophila kikkawai]|uniref:Uncharacterized protein isoform X2 n=1 Tax=Drosophila kikkawai TaxID=30033 RepID=A0ABM4G9I9_DROKI
MSGEQLEKPLGDAENITRVKGESARPLCDLSPRILSEHNYTILLPEPLPSKLNLRKLVCSIHARTSPKESKMLPRSELSVLVRNADVLLRRLRRLLGSRRRFIDFKPMDPLQETIAQELAKRLGCQTRFYNDWNDSRYLVAYRPGVEPNALEVRVRQMCQEDRGLEIFMEEVESNQLQPISLSDKKLLWHRPIIVFEQRQMPANSTQSSLALGRKIFEKLKPEFRPIR